MLVKEIEDYLPSEGGLTSSEYNVFNSSVFLHFLVNGENLDLDELAKESVRRSVKKELHGRPLLIYNFDPREASIIVSSPYYLEKTVLSSNRSYIHVDYSSEGRSLHAYIFDHQYSAEEGLKIINTEKNYYTALKASSRKE